MLTKVERQKLFRAMGGIAGGVAWISLSAAGLSPILAFAGRDLAREAVTIDVMLSGFRADPAEITLLPGPRYPLHFVKREAGVTIPLQRPSPPPPRSAIGELGYGPVCSTRVRANSDQVKPHDRG